MHHVEGPGPPVRRVTPWWSMPDVLVGRESRREQFHHMASEIERCNGHADQCDRGDQDSVSEYDGKRRHGEGCIRVGRDVDVWKWMVRGVGSSDKRAAAHFLYSHAGRRSRG